MKKRVQLKPEVRIQERRWIMQFALNHIEKDPESKGVPTEEAFAEYQKYVRKQRLGKSVISIDGFGRMLPRNLKTKMYFSQNAKTNRKHIVGVRID